PGSNVGVAPVDSTTGSTPISLTFSDVTGAGTTSLTTSSAGPTPPSGFTVAGAGIYYDISTTATFTGTVTVCVTYNPASVADPTAVRFFHYNTGTAAWEDITTSNDTTTGTLCGTTTSFSPFAILTPSGTRARISGTMEGNLRVRP